MNIVLIGMRGSGKSTVGKLLAKKLNKQFIDTDRLLAEREGKQLPEIITLFGWDYFRNKESDIAEEVAKQTNAVISTGGGIILRQKNIDALGNKGMFVFLKASISEILKRIGRNKNRPSLTGKKSFTEELEDVWNERKKIYKQTADIIIETDNKTIEQIAEEIKKHFSNITV
jgi:shikimate kinase